MSQPRHFSDSLIDRPAQTWTRMIENDARSIREKKSFLYCMSKKGWKLKKKKAKR